MRNKKKIGKRILAGLMVAFALIAIGVAGTYSTKANADANDSLPSGLDIHNSNQGGVNYSMASPLTVRTDINVNSPKATINPGDTIKFNIANTGDAENDSLMKQVVNWSSVTTTGGSEYGNFTVDQNTGIGTYTFTKRVYSTTGSFSLTLNVPFKNPTSSRGVNFSSSLTQGNRSYAIQNKFYYGVLPIDPNNVSPNRVQAPSMLSGLNYSGVHRYVGPSANNGIPKDERNFNPKDGDEPSFCNVAYPTNGPRDPNLVSLTGRTYTSEVQGPGAKVDINNLRFGLPESDSPYALPWGGQYAGKWISLAQLKEVLPGVEVSVDQVNQNDAKMVIKFPDGQPIQYLQWTANFVCPDVNSDYHDHSNYTDNQKTISNYEVDGTFKYQTNDEHGFFPTINNAENKAINLDNFDDKSIDDFLKQGITVDDAQDGNITDKLQITDDTDLVNALKGKKTGTYSVSFAVTDSKNLTSYATINVTIYSNIKVNYVDEQGNVIKNPTIMSGNAGDSFTITPPDIAGYNYEYASVPNLTGLYGEVDQPSSITLTYKGKQDNVTNTIVYKDKDGKQISNSRKVTGQPGTQIPSSDIHAPQGYKLSDASKPYTFGKDGSEIDVQVEPTSLNPGRPDNVVNNKIVYEDNNDIPVGNPRTVSGREGSQVPASDIKAPDGYSLADASKAYTFGKNGSEIDVQVNKNAAPSQPANANNGNNSHPQNPNNGVLGNNGVQKHSKVYAMKSLNLYRNSNLTGKIKHYKKVKRTKRPRFFVKKIVRTKNGAVRYYVKQLNVHRYGWISGNTKLTQNNYYQPRTKPVKFRVLNRKGIHSYRTLTMHKKAKHLKYGSVIKARRVKKDGLQTRFQLSNGTYVSARKNFVIYK